MGDALYDLSRRSKRSCLSTATVGISTWWRQIQSQTWPLSLLSPAQGRWLPLALVDQAGTRLLITVFIRHRHHVRARYNKPFAARGERCVSFALSLVSFPSKTSSRTQKIILHLSSASFSGRTSAIPIQDLSATLPLHGPPF